MENEWAKRFGSEWTYIEKIGRAIIDPKDKREFWENLKKRKLADKDFSIYTLYPLSKQEKNKVKSELEKAREACLQSVLGRKKDVGEAK